MSGIPLRQIRAVIAVCEEGSFTRAAERENATQSGISQHVAAVERALRVRLFERTTAGVVPTPAGLRYYKRCTEAIGLLENAAEEARASCNSVTGDLRVGLMPTFTRAVLAPVLEDFIARHPDVRLRVVEGYSGLLTELVLANELDFAVVPAFEGQIGLKVSHLVRDREILISRHGGTAAPLVPVRLKELRPLKVIVPGPDNVRRRNLETYFQTHDVSIDAKLELDAMIGTFELIARSDWVTVLPSLIAVNDIASGEFTINAIDPPLYAEFVMIQPARQMLSAQARLLLDRLQSEVAHIHEVWNVALAASAAGEGANARTPSKRRRAARAPHADALAQP